MSKRQNRLMGPSGGFFEIDFEDRIAALREELIHARAVADGLEAAWKKAIDKYMPVLERKAGFEKSKTYSLPLAIFEELSRVYGFKQNTFIYSHVEGNEYGLPGFYFWPTNADGKKSKRGPFRLLTIDDVRDKWGNGLQETQRGAS